MQSRQEQKMTNSDANLVEDSVDQEAEHFHRILTTFRYYKTHSLRSLQRRLASYKCLPLNHQRILEPFVEHLTRVRECIYSNQEFLSSIASKVDRLFENQSNDPSPENHHPENSKASDFNMDKLNSTLRQFVRDWSEEGAEERRICYGPLLDDLKRLLPCSREISVLVPGAGLGRLAWEIANLGFCCEGNEFSLFMLFGSNFMLNHCPSPNCIKFYPWINQWSNNLTYADQIRSVTIPDIDTASLASNPLVRFSMSAGDFTDIYRTPEPLPTPDFEATPEAAECIDGGGSKTASETVTAIVPSAFDCVVTCFFIDTARNPLQYVEMISRLLKPGGYWLNIGPLLYHYADQPGVDSIELPYEQLKKSIVEEFGFEFLDEKIICMTYAQNTRSTWKYSDATDFPTCKQTVVFCIMQIPRMDIIKRWLFDRYTDFEKFCCKILKSGPIPKHVAFIMDGNRRYARKHALESVVDGHSQGFDTLSNILEWCKELGIDEVTVYAFSIENFKRSKDEVDGLMNLARQKLQKLLSETSEVDKNGVRFRFFGNLSMLPPDVQQLIAQITLSSMKNTRLFLNVCIAYTSRDEITRALNEIVSATRSGHLHETDIDDQLISRVLDSRNSPDPDLLIRTSGENRFSDFLLYQCSYTCLYFDDVLWPDYNLWHLLRAVFHYQMHCGNIEKIKLSHSKIFANKSEGQVNRLREYVEMIENRNTEHFKSLVAKT